jgi:hypothetical protein
LGAPLISESEVARRLGVSQSYIRQLRQKGRTPEATRCSCGHAMLYKDDEALDRWLADFQQRRSA